jgi:hypothetical protein
MKKDLLIKIHLLMKDDSLDLPKLKEFLLLELLPFLAVSRKSIGLLFSSLLIETELKNGVPIGKTRELEDYTERWYFLHQLQLIIRQI